MVIGLDCAAPELVFDRWLDDLPNLKALYGHGLHGPLRSCDPPITVPFRLAVPPRPGSATPKSTTAVMPVACTVDPAFKLRSSPENSCTTLPIDRTEAPPRMVRSSAGPGESMVCRRTKFEAVTLVSTNRGVATTVTAPLAFDDPAVRSSTGVMRSPPVLRTLTSPLVELLNARYDTAVSRLLELPMLWLRAAPGR